MFDSQLLGFALIAAVLAVTPGADTMLVMKNSVRMGSRSGWATTAGILGGVSVHAIASSLGISVIVTRSTTLFELIKWLGALYLIWLGLQAIRTSAERQKSVGEQGSSATSRGAFTEGLVTNVLNPKVAIFYIAFLPQFINQNDPIFAKSLLLASIHNLLSLLWLGTLVWAIASAKEWIEKPKVQASLSRISGVVLIGLGLRIAFESR